MKPVSNSSKQPTLQTVERSLSFLEFVASSPEPPTVQRVADALDLNITTCYHLLRTLVARGYIKRHDNLTLSLGEQVGVLFRTYQQKMDIDESLKGMVDTLASKTSETAYLSVLDGNRVVLKVLVEGSQQLRVSGLFVGQSGNEHLRSSGKAVLAHLDDEARAAMLADVVDGMSASETESLLDRLGHELDQTRKRGWSMDEQGSDIGISSIGGPIFDSRGRIYGAIGVVTPTTRMERLQDHYVECVRAVAADATALLTTAPTT
ncbi:IclR family transcriptional regulator [Arthrobacter sp. StoSoilA2]|uniref:IclR family transcriptional regulator n=1 Tax=Arthrobacter sp. StoSoilA2 TaxID=2830990 RepID=UPI001CC4C656|nr:IclR family transcriptional regulator [Arthrobacter sp. StoSoilA2]